MNRHSYEILEYNAKQDSIAAHSRLLFAYLNGWCSAIEAATKMAMRISDKLGRDGLPSTSSGAKFVADAIHNLKPPDEQPRVDEMQPPTAKAE